MKRKIYPDSMAVQTVLVVVFVIFFAVLAMSSIIINISEKIFVNTYGRSQEQVFERIEEELKNFHENIMKVGDQINASWYLKIYLENKVEDPRLAFQAAYKAKEDMENALDTGIDDVSFIVISENGRSYMDKAESITTPTDEILSSEAAKEALQNPDAVFYVYLDRGYTDATNDGPALMLVRALVSPGENRPYGVLLATIKEDAFSGFYEYFASENSEFYLADQNGFIVSSSEKEKLNTKFDKDTFSMHTVLHREIPYFHFTAYGVIDNEKALGNLYNIPQLWILCGFVIFVTAVLIFFLVRRITRPLSAMVEKMSNARKEKFDEHIVPSGTRETKELAATYNTMLDELNRYIDELMNIQKEKRKAEISALQMQINPHYVYNTLASIKWLIFQGDTEKSTRTIDAFISLLRSTIGNTDEYITVEEEIKNLKNYVLINNIRYGNKVQVEYFTAFGCEKCRIPKMILQPFVENSFFHAFPGEQRGNIQIFARRLEGNLQIRITDDGIGMNEEQLMELAENKRKGEHFTGIGVGNVDARLKLLYGSDYGIHIESEENEGTTIIINIPLNI